MTRLIAILLIVTFTVSVVSPLFDVATAQRTEPKAEETPTEASDELADEPIVSLEGPIDPETYVLGPSDELILILKGGETMSHTLFVLAEGNVILPNVGAFPAAGKTLAAFRDEVRVELRRYYRNVEIDCQLAHPRSFVVYVLGAVRKPRPVQLTAPFRLSQAIRKAGDVVSDGSTRRIEIRRSGELERTVDLFKFWHLGDDDHNPTLSEGQTVFVPPKVAEVQVIGEVNLPDTYELVPGETAADIIRYCGGIGPLGDPSRILLERVEGGDIKPLQVFTEETANQIPLEHLDIIIVRNVISFSAYHPVEVFGGGGRTGMVRVAEEQTLREFLDRLWRFSPDFDLEAAVIERDTEGSSPEFIHFNVRKVLAGDESGLVMVKPGDILMFPPAERNVFVTGRVQVPGPLPFQAGFTVERYIALAGGPDSEGSFDKIKIQGRDGERRDGDRNSPVYRGETIVVGRKTSSILSSLFSGAAIATSLLLSVIAVTR